MSRRNGIPVGSVPAARVTESDVPTSARLDRPVAVVHDLDEDEAFR